MLTASERLKVASASHGTANTTESRSRRASETLKTAIDTKAAAISTLPATFVLDTLAIHSLPLPK